MSRIIDQTRMRHRWSHSELLADVVDTYAPPSCGLDAIIVPAARKASSLDLLIDLSVRLGATLVVLCSRLASVEDVADRVARTAGAKALIIDVPGPFSLRHLPQRTARREFHEANGGRASDLSAKRNLGLLLARLRGWHKIAFVDDDITLTDVSLFRCLAKRLDDHPIAGMVCRDYPDNSVLCHAIRLAGFRQDNFVSGSVLGVNCVKFPQTFFPDIYNEDWFFFSQAVVDRTLTSVGNATQLPYRPFADPERARSEEFGDLLAEGLYSLIGDMGPDLRYENVLKRATQEFWQGCIDGRREVHAIVEACLADTDTHEARQAMKSVLVAQDQLALIKPATCVSFLEAWHDDLQEWAISSALIDHVVSPWEAMATLGVRQWRHVADGDARLGESKRLRDRSLELSCSSR